MPATLAQRLQLIANSLLHPLGLHMVRTSQASGMNDLLARAAARGVVPGTIIDIGASDGVWSLGARRHFPDSRFLLFEPLDEQRSPLEKLNQKLGFEIVNAVAGETKGTVAMQISEDLDGSNVVSIPTATSRIVPVESIDAIVAERSLPAPYLIKLDTHGYEKEVLDGASSSLKQACLVIVESYNFKLTENCLRFHELCAWFEERGFRCCDLADPLRRLEDGLLWQLDLAFAPANSPFFSKTTYR